MTFILPCHASLSSVPYSCAFSVLSGGYVPCNHSSCTWRTSFLLYTIYLCVVASCIAKLDDVYIIIIYFVATS